MKMLPNWKEGLLLAVVTCAVFGVMTLFVYLGMLDHRSRTPSGGEIALAVFTAAKDDTTLQDLLPLLQFQSARCNDVAESCVAKVKAGEGRVLSYRVPYDRSTLHTGHLVISAHKRTDSLTDTLRTGNTAEAE